MTSDAKDYGRYIFSANIVREYIKEYLRKLRPYCSSVRIENPVAFTPDPLFYSAVHDSVVRPIGCGTLYEPSRSSVPVYVFPA